MHYVAIALDISQFILQAAKLVFIIIDKPCESKNAMHRHKRSERMVNCYGSTEITQCAEENSTKRSKEEKLLYSGLTGVLQEFQNCFFPHS